MRISQRRNVSAFASHIWSGKKSSNFGKSYSALQEASKASRHFQSTLEGPVGGVHFNFQAVLAASTSVGSAGETPTAMETSMPCQVSAEHISCLSSSIPLLKRLWNQQRQYGSTAYHRDTLTPTSPTQDPRRLCPDRAPQKISHAWACDVLSPA